MKMDFSRFKKIRSDEKTTTLRHPEGHSIIVAHHALSPEMRKQIKAIPAKYSDGGEVDDGGRSPASVGKKVNGSTMPQKYLDAMEEIKAKEGPVPGDPDYHPGVWDTIKNAFNNQMEHGFMLSEPAQAAPRVPAQVAPAPAAISEPQQPQQVAAPLAPQPPVDPMGMDAYAKNYMGALGEEKAGIRQEAAAQGALGQQQMAVEGEQQKLMQQMNADYQKHSMELQKEYQGVVNDVKNQHINPNHYMESMSSGKKVATAIGLILGGMGGALGGVENPAAKFLHQQIQNDIEAQRLNLGKSETLLSANLKQFGNLHDATQMTMAMQNGIYASKLREAAAKATDPLAKARALKEAGTLDMQAAPILQQLAMKKTAFSAMNGASDPAQKVRMGLMTGIIPKEEGEHIYKELEEAQTMVKARDNVMSAMQAVNAKNTLGNRVFHPFNSESEIDAIWKPMVAGLSKDTAGRFTEQDAEMLNTLKPKLSDSEAVVKEKIRRADALMQTKMHFPRLKAYGINPYTEQRFGDGGQKKIQLGPAVK